MKDAFYSSYRKSVDCYSGYDLMTPKQLMHFTLGNYINKLIAKTARTGIIV